MHQHIKTLLFCLLIKKSIINSQIKHDIKEYNGIKFSVGLSIQFFNDEGNGKQKQVIGQNHREQSAIFDDNKVDDFMIVKLHIYKLGLKNLQTLPLV